MGSVSRSLDLMEHIATAASPPTHADMLRQFDIPKSTLSGILAELRSSGFVTLDDGRYLAGPRFTSLAYRGVGSINRQSSIRRQLEQLAADHARDHPVRGASRADRHRRRSRRERRSHSLRP